MIFRNNRVCVCVCTNYKLLKKNKMNIFWSVRRMKEEYVALVTDVIKQYCVKAGCFLMTFTKYIFTIIRKYWDFALSSWKNWMKSNGHFKFIAILSSHFYRITQIWMQHRGASLQTFWETIVVKMMMKKRYCEGAPSPPDYEYTEASKQIR